MPMCCSAALVEEIMGTLREELSHVEKTNWRYETNDPQVHDRIKP